ncbi:MAG TPA: glutathione S-transferase N-terminal domain-containing protein [Kaistia sp.]|nr:glutathione S-transferase N-terminal domain-containing protein [Kaistia sp.]
MADYELLYWSAPFRGQFVRAALAFAGKSWTEGGDAKISRLMAGPVDAMPVPFMGPPVLIDHKADVAIAEMPAIILYLGETLNLMPDTPELRAMTMKIVNDANDVIDEITLNGGDHMWSEKRWEEYKPRLAKWMSIWEDTGRRYGLDEDAGHILGGESAGLADVISATLWTTMTDRFSKIRDLFETTAPMTAALCLRVSALSPLAKLSDKAHKDYGDAYAGGQIGASMAKILDD